LFGSLSFVFDKSAGISLAIERVGVSRVRVRYVSEVLSRGGLRVVFQRECLGLREGEEEQRPEREAIFWDFCDDSERLLRDGERKREVLV